MALKCKYVKCCFCVVLYVCMCVLLSAVKIKFLTAKQNFKGKSSNETDVRTLVSPKVHVENIIETSSFESDASNGTFDPQLSVNIKIRKDRIKNIEENSSFENELVESTIDGCIDLQDELEPLQRVSQTCVKYKLKSALVRKHYLRSPQDRAMFCWIRKVASTSFTKLFLDLHNRRVFKDYYKEGDVLAPESHERLVTLAKNRNVFKFLIVRHPFERLVSSYRDRLEDNTRYTAQAWFYTQRIFHLTRPKLFHSNKTTGSTLSRIFSAGRRLKLVPSFEEFVKWLLREPIAKDDVHWAQYHSHCSLCEISYNVVLKLENYTSEWVNYISSKLRADKSQSQLPRLEESRGGSTDFAMTCSYFRNLTQDTVLQLYQRYKIDFEMFAYDLKRYVGCAKAGT